MVFLLGGQNSVTTEEGKNGDWRFIGSFDHKSSKQLRLNDAGYKWADFQLEQETSQLIQTQAPGHHA